MALSSDSPPLECPHCKARIDADCGLAGFECESCGGFVNLTKPKKLEGFSLRSNRFGLSKRRLMLNTVLAAALLGIGLYLAVRVAAAIHFQQIRGYERVTAVSLIALLSIGVAIFLFRDSYKRWRIDKQ